MREQHNVPPKTQTNRYRQTLNDPLYRPLLTDRNELPGTNWVTLLVT